MTTLERRQTPRTAVAGHAYINIEPNNGGMVLNVSDGGLCFHSFDPVQRNGKVRFWFSDRNRRIEALGTLAWTDETHKGGLQFTSLPPEAQEQLRHWVKQSAVATPANGGLPPVGISVTPPKPMARPAANPAPSAVSAAAVPAITPAAVSSESRTGLHLSGFSRGLATGLLISAAVVAAFLFQSYRREFGESLIRLGERFAAKPEVQAAAAPPSTAATLPAAAPILATTTAPQTTPATTVPVPPPPALKVSRAPDRRDERTQTVKAKQERVQAQPDRTAQIPRATPVSVQPAKLEPAKPASNVPAPLAANLTAPKITAPAVLVSSTSSPNLPAVAAAPGPAAGEKNVPSAKAEATKPPEIQTETSTAENNASTSELYFEVGKFRNQSQAHIEMNKLSQLGFPATAVQKGFLWTNSYHVLVGPYGDEGRARATHLNLVSNGFKPRPFERGSRAFTLGSPVTLNGTHTPAGDYIISWESYLDDASVKFLHNDFMVAKANARWVKREAKYARDAYVYRRNGDGSRTLLEIRFGGTHQALVFGKVS